MILDVDHWYCGYQQIVADCRASSDDYDNGTAGGGGGSALILCNADVDSMAAARILSYVLRSDGVSHQIQPCMAYSQLLHIISQSNLVGNDLRAVVLLNLGATRNLTKLFGAGADNSNTSNGLDASVKVYVMDCRRPVHLANYYAGDNVVIFFDDINGEDPIPSDGDNLSGNESSTDEEDSDDDDDDSESESDEDDSDLDDGEQEFEMEEDDKPDESEKPTGDSDPLDPSTDYDGGDESDDSTTKRQKKKKSVDGDDGDDDNALASDDEMKDDTTEAEAGKDSQATQDTSQQEQQEQQQPTMTPRERYHERRNRLRSYYSNGSCYGSPASFVAYNMATDLRFKDVGDLLWLACVGVTDAYLQARLDVAAYTTFAIRLRNDCNRLFPNDMYERVGNAVYAEHLLGTNINNNDSTQQDQQQGQGPQQRTRIGFSGNGRVFSQDDFRFFLLRHTSLWEAMMYSDFVSTRLQLTTKQGVQKLQEFLAKMGYPLEECRQPFAFMKPKFRRRLQSQIHAHAEEYGLENFGFTSFFRVTGYQSLLSASDTSHAVTALLESETPSMSGSNSNDSSESPEKQEEEALMRSFNIAYDALNSNGSSSSSLSAVNTLTSALGDAAAGGGNNLMNLVSGGSLAGHSTGIGAGIRLAMMQQKNIMATAASLIDRHAITRLSHFRYAYITCTSNSGGAGQGAENQPRNNGGGSKDVKQKQAQQQQHIFAKPLALSRLAHYLMDLHRENGKWTGAKSRPLVLMAEKPLTQTYLVVGFEYPESAGSVVPNRFGTKFELAAQSIKGSFRFDSFDSNVVEVAATVVQRFIEQLHYLMDSV